MIYFFEMLNAGEVKIGYSGKSPETRLIQATTWAKVRALLVLPDGTRKDEKRWHRDFAHLRTAGERFTLTEELRGLIAELTFGFDWDSELRRRSLEADRLRRAKPEAREVQRLYRANPEYREFARLRAATLEYREADRLRNKRPERREADRIRQTTPEAREAQRLRRAKPKAREAQRLYDANRRRKIHGLPEV